MWPDAFREMTFSRGLISRPWQCSLYEAMGIEALDKLISEKITTEIITSMLGDASGWASAASAEGDTLAKGRIRILVDTHEVHIRDDDGEWLNLILSERDIARVQDVAYDMLHDPHWASMEADPAKIALAEFNLL